MSTTLRILCEEYHLSTPDAISALQSSGILVLSPDAELSAFKEGSYRKILSSAASPGPRASRPKPPRRRRGRLLFCRPRLPRAQHPGPPLWITNSVSARS